MPFNDSEEFVCLFFNYRTRKEPLQLPQPVQRLSESEPMYDSDSDGHDFDNHWEPMSDSESDGDFNTRMSYGHKEQDGPTADKENNYVGEPILGGNFDAQAGIGLVNEQRGSNVVDDQTGIGHVYERIGCDHANEATPTAFDNVEEIPQKLQEFLNRFITRESTTTESYGSQTLFVLKNQQNK